MDFCRNFMWHCWSFWEVSVNLATPCDDKTVWKRTHFQKKPCFRFLWSSRIFPKIKTYLPKAKKRYFLTTNWWSNFLSAILTALRSDAKRNQKPWNCSRWELRLHWLFGKQLNQLFTQFGWLMSRNLCLETWNNCCSSETSGIKCNMPKASFVSLVVTSRFHTHIVLFNSSRDNLEVGSLSV